MEPNEGFAKWVARDGNAKRKEEVLSHGEQGEGIGMRLRAMWSEMEGAISFGEEEYTSLMGGDHRVRELVEGTHGGDFSWAKGAKLFW